jgi:hypothetical protein
MAEQLLWVDADGVEHELFGDEARALLGVSGRAMPPIDFTDFAARPNAGSSLTEIRHGAREVAVPVALLGDVQAGVRTWSRRFDPVRGEGRLRARSTAGDRDLPCRYVGGLDGAVEDVPSLRRFVAVFRAFDPYWRDVNATQVTIERGELGLWLPWPPVTVVSDDVFATVTVNNDGDVQAFPVWTVSGPATSVSLTTDRGDALTVAFPINANETLTIDTRPGFKTVTDQDGNNRFSSLDVNEDSLFGFAVGVTQVSVSIVDPSPDSRVNLSWRRRYLSA